MKSSLVLISAIAAATAGLAVSSNVLASPSDAQAQAAALLSPSYVAVSGGAQDNASSQSVAVDAQAQAAALLGGVRVERDAEASAQVLQSTAARSSGDAQAQAAALLSSSQSPAVEDVQSTATNEKLGAHPAVIVAQTWRNRGIDPNVFIVAHPARLQLVTASPSATQLARFEGTVSAEVAQSRGTVGLVTGASGE